MAIRFKAFLRYRPGANMAQWAEAQMAVRLGQAFHLRAGTPEAEMSKVERDGDNLTIDVLWPDDKQSLADDTIATLFAASVTWWVEADIPPDQVSFASWHWCNHDQDPPTPCPDPVWAWSK